MEPIEGGKQGLVYGRAEKEASLLVPMKPKAQKLGVKEAPTMV